MVIQDFERLLDEDDEVGVQESDDPVLTLHSSFMEEIWFIFINYSLPSLFYFWNKNDGTFQQSQLNFTAAS